MSDKPHVITKAEALKLLRRARDEKGKDYVDPGSSGRRCHYVYPKMASEGGDPPRCIVGQVFHYLGIGDDMLKSLFGGVWEILPRKGHESECDYSPLNSHLVATEAAFNVLQAAQDAQDAGQTWGDAVREASLV